ncbi:uncharacterized protein EI90DRAFT_3134797 [Cantharellus anzutake]|uniref:uncharacterized protein n=1 Tax=Cantharellus anzutake TaxID=1750568 RepID=UPI001904E1FF|nr:uncharacterized protein EI90DRAFT_3134797 [Cantharellus anzutake]KAF8316019.1 hypothetical protein EI90DRAFT_3134797 [Cantharellus anzutake]
MDSQDVKLDAKLSILRDRVPSTLLHTFHVIDEQNRVQKAFELCRSGKFDLSHASLTSRPLRVVLDDLLQTNSDLAKAIMAPQKCPNSVAPDPSPIEHEGEFTDAAEDDVEVKIEDIIKHMDGAAVPDGLEAVQGSLQTASTCAEEAEIEELGNISTLPVPIHGQELGHGMRARRTRNLEDQMKIFLF